MKMRIVLWLTLALPAFSAAAADEQPWFASMKSDKTYMRDGPGEDYQIKWVYHRKGMPVEVIGAYDAWRKVRDMDGETGWIHTVLLARERTGVVIGDGLAPIQRSEGDSDLVAKAKPGTVGRLRHCDALACEVKFDGVEGWVPRSRLWGLNNGERF
jgi:SH3-like domain-containing protein